jgi:membrane protease subunit (stomatin/prohibitin family)
MMKIKGSKARKTFHWEDHYKGENLMFRIPENIYWNDNVVVREDEWAVFLRDGKSMAVFDRPGRYAITTQNLPVLASITAKLTGIKQLGEVYYVQRREMRGKFGTSEPLAFRDSEFGLVRIRMFGDFSYKVEDPNLFITQFVGTKGITKTDEVIRWLKKQLVMSMNDALGELKRDKNMSIIDMPAYLEEFEQVLLTKVSDDTDRYGLKVMKIVGLNINLPEEVQEAIDKRGAMSALGVDYIKYETGKAIGGIGEGAAKGGGGGAGGDMAGMGAGIGAGFGMANAMTNAMQGVAGPGKTGQAGEGPKKNCPKCSTMLDENAKFCSNCGHKFPSDEKQCPKCNNPVAANAKFCPSCGEKLGGSTVACPKCNGEVAAGVKFCPNCGNKMG